MQIILLLDLLLNLPVDIQTNDKRIASPGRRSGVAVDNIQGIVQVPDRLAGAVDFLLHSILKITSKTLDFFDFLMQIVAEAHQLVDNFAFNLGGFVRLEIALSMEVAEDLGRIGDTARFEEGWRHRRIVDDVGSRQEQFRAHFVGFLDFFEKDD